MADEAISFRARSSVSEPMARKGDDHSLLHRMVLRFPVEAFIVRIFRGRRVRLLVLVEVQRMDVPSPKSIGSLL